MKYIFCYKIKYEERKSIYVPSVRFLTVADLIHALYLPIYEETVKVKLKAEYF